MDGTESTDSAAGEESGGTRGVNRRRVLRAGAFTAAAFFIAHATGDFGPLRAAAESGALGRGEERDGAPRHSGPYTDDPIDPAAVADGSARWSPTRYGPADEIGALNEITPHKTLEALQLIKNNRNKPPRTYSMGELLEPNVPAFGTRVYEQTLVGPVPPPYLGANQVNFLEERINTTYQIGTQLDGLCHFGVGDVWYNGLRTEQMVAGNPHGASRCGQELVRPFVTRGILLDVLSVKVRQGASDALGPPVDGKPILANSYRITLEDLEAAMELGKTGPVEAGDVVVIRTGWTHLFSATDPVKKARYLATEPGIYLREARWLADRRPAIVASDTWALEVLPAPAPWSGTQLFPVHQELITHHGIRVGEAFRSEELAADRVYKFVFFYTGVRAKGATCGNVSPGALA
jgi:kynurenine formamidase